MEEAILTRKRRPLLDIPFYDSQIIIAFSVISFYDSRESHVIALFKGLFGMIICDDLEQIVEEKQIVFNNLKAEKYKSNLLYRQL